MLEQPTVSTAGGPGTAASTSRMQAQISYQFQATSKDCEPGNPGVRRVGPFVPGQGDGPSVGGEQGRAAAAGTRV